MTMNYKNIKHSVCRLKSEQLRLISLKLCTLVRLSVDLMRALTSYEYHYIIAGNIKLNQRINVDILDYVYLAISIGRCNL